MKTYLKVPFAEKDAAKALGARFDMSRKSWYVPDGLDLINFRKWLPKEVSGYWDKLKKKTNRYL